LWGGASALPPSFCSASLPNQRHFRGQESRPEGQRQGRSPAPQEPEMTPTAKRPFITLLASHWISMLGVALTTTAGFSWLFVLPQHLRGRVSHPYIGILIFLIIPALLFLGLALIPVGVFLARRRIASGLSGAPDRKAAWRRLGLFFGLM